MRELFTRLLAVIVVAGACLVTAAPAAAHNSLESAQPPDRSEIAAGSTLLLRFAKDVPLATMSVDVTASSGARTGIDGLRHGASARDVVVPLGAIPAGAISLRWRLVGPDGHVVTSRLRYTIRAAAGQPTGTTSTTTPPEATGDEGGSALAGFGQWLVRLASYIALMVGVGVVATTRFVWPDASRLSRLRRVPSLAMAAVAALALVQLTQLAATIEQQPWWKSLGSLDVAAGTDVGKALLFRLVVAGAAALLLARGMARLRGARGDLVLGAIGLALVLSWALGGHARSLRWPILGVPVDAAHHLAAATWVGGLAIVGGVALRTLGPEDARPVVVRFSRIAGAAVAVLALTGLLGTLRFVDSFGTLFDAHNRLLAAKLLVVGLMLAAGNVNRKRVIRWASRPDAPRARQVWALRRAMTTELVLGAIVLAVTAALVVTTPTA